jgi:single-stranded-DNA-specific exonuclease
MMETVWNFKPYDKDKARSLAFELEIPEPAAAVYVSRGLDSEEKINEYISLPIKALHNPKDLPDIKPVTERLLRALENNEKIWVHGDYDVDGITSTAIVVKTLRLLRANFGYHVPHRVEEGYDIKRSAVDRAVKNGATLLMSVDCGILAFDTAEYAKEQGIDLIITDHHTPSADGRLPDCIGVVNPHRADSKYPFDGLAGCGIAFKVMAYLAHKHGGHSPKAMLDLLGEYVCLGTVADIAPMEDENRTMVAYGCKLLDKTESAGIRQLMKIASVKRVDTMSIGFGLGPRLNAIGRLGDSAHALELLLANTESKAKRLALQLDATNKERQRLQEICTQEAIALLPEDMSDTDIIVLAAKHWEQGLTGLIAGKIAEKFARPTLICSILPNGIAKGSCRSSGDFHILNALKSKECEGLFVSCGGHSFAAGFSLEAEKVDLLREKINEYARNLKEGKVTRQKGIDIDARITLNSISDETYEAITKLAPFGSGNPDPIFACRRVVVAKCSLLGKEGKHVKMMFQSPKMKGQWIPALAWHKGYWADEFKEGDIVDIAFSFMREEYNGKIGWTTLLKDIRKCEI